MASFSKLQDRELPQSPQSLPLQSSLKENLINIANQTYFHNRQRRESFKIGGFSNQDAKSGGKFNQIPLRRALKNFQSFNPNAFKVQEKLARSVLTVDKTQVIKVCPEEILKFAEKQTRRQADEIKVLKTHNHQLLDPSLLYNESESHPTNQSFNTPSFKEFIYRDFYQPRPIPPQSAYFGKTLQRTTSPQRQHSPIRRQSYIRSERVSLSKQFQRQSLKREIKTICDRSSSKRSQLSKWLQTSREPSRSRDVRNQLQRVSSNSRRLPYF